MSPDPIFVELARFTYFLANVDFFGIVFSIFYSINNGNIWSHISKQNVGARHFLIIFLIGLLIYFLGDRFLSEPIISFISNLENTGLPLSVFTFSFVAFYVLKVIARRRLRFPDVKITLSITIISAVITVVMLLNDNKLL